MKQGIGDEIRQFRVENDVTIEDMVTRINKLFPRRGIHPSTISRIERGVTPNARTEYKLRLVLSELSNSSAEAPAADVTGVTEEGE
jgi:transcriptional regulator with XRE-family HTH domain